MRVARRARGAVAVLAAVAVGGIADGPSAHASDGEWGLNGTYTATSNGEWARTNDVFRDEASLRGIWTISTTCSYPTECTGTVQSDFGWSAPIYMTGGIWYVKRTVPNWEPCPDGTASPGFQVYRFVPVVEDGSQVDPTSTTLAGEDQTTGTPGACGISKPLFINMPFKLVEVGA
jgi:hypothetical protein